MPTLKEWILSQADGEPVEAVVLGEMGWGDYGSEDIPTESWKARGKLLTWEEAEPLITYEFDDGYGSPTCQSLTAWTKSWIIAVSEYDGSTRPFRLARNPIACMPPMPGGG